MTGFQNGSAARPAADTENLLQVRSTGVAVGVKSEPLRAADTENLLQVRSAGVAVGVKS